ncbi:5'-methylthioadenosine phosphorylase [alpha proteobacterium U9-1i]|nr:5'-methylthioadenosine phosphorylase [alpha proteobacterium U9-1i]
MARTVLGVIGGSGLYSLPLQNVREERVATPWGEPSDALRMGTLEGVDLVFLARHGRGHLHSPSAINYRANIDALKRVGCTDLITFSACGSLREDLPPGHFMIIDQLIDRTIARETSFFGTGLVTHVSMADPVCPKLADALDAAAKAEKLNYKRGGTLLVIEGPQFSSYAESQLYRQWKCDVIGMTAMPEAKLAREAELPYASVAMVTDFDCWHPDHAHVDVADVVKVMHENADKAANLLKRVAPMLGPERKPSPTFIEQALETAIMTAPAQRDPHLMAKLDAVAGRVLRKTK